MNYCAIEQSEIEIQFVLLRLGKIAHQMEMREYTVKVSHYQFVIICRLNGRRVQSRTYVII